MAICAEVGFILVMTLAPVPSGFLIIVRSLANKTNQLRQELFFFKTMMDSHDVMFNRTVTKTNFNRSEFSLGKLFTLN